jgi:hypothetical protein
MKLSMMELRPLSPHKMRRNKMRRKKVGKTMRENLLKAPMLG